MENQKNSISFVMMGEFKKDNCFINFVNFENKNKTFENMNSSSSRKVMSKEFIAGGVKGDFINLSCESFFKNRIFSTEFINRFLAISVDNRIIIHFLNNSSVELNLIKGPFSALSNSLINDSFIEISSTGCQSICSQNSQSSSVTSPVCLNLADMSCFINLITALTNNLESNCRFSSGELINFINNKEDLDYLKLSKWLKIRSLKPGMEIAVPDEKGKIRFEKIISIIKHKKKQHVYDLAIQGTYNFIANNIMTPNTYLGDSAISDDGTTITVDLS